VSAVTITLPAFAKINLYLRILGKRPDGYHDLDTALQTISLHDTIRFVSSESSRVGLTTGDRSLSTGEENLIMRAAAALKDRFGCQKGAQLRLQKRIPLQAGLGGGSANAAVTLLGLNRLWQLDAPRSELLKIAANLGADVPFFLLGGTARAAGVGSQLTQLADAPEKFLLVIKPNASISTAAAYTAWDEHSLTTQNPKTILSSSRSADVLDHSGLLHLDNDFAAVAFDLEPEIFRAKAALISAGAQAVLLAGSGSAIFGIFDSEDAQGRATQGTELETGWRVFPCKTIGHDRYWAALADAVA